jgi:hypothetical protein
MFRLALVRLWALETGPFQCGASTHWDGARIYAIYLSRTLWVQTPTGRPVLEHEMAHINQYLQGRRPRFPTHATPDDFVTYFRQHLRCEYEAHVLAAVGWGLPIPETPNQTIGHSCARRAHHTALGFLLEALAKQQASGDLTLSPLLVLHDSLPGFLQDLGAANQGPAGFRTGNLQHLHHAPSHLRKRLPPAPQDAPALQTIHGLPIGEPRLGRPRGPAPIHAAARTTPQPRRSHEAPYATLRAPTHDPGVCPAHAL